MNKYSALLNTCFIYFLKGLLLIIPLSFTGYIISIALQKIDGIIPVKFPGLGMIIIIASITLLGYIGSTLFVKSAFDLTESFISKVPVIGTVYTSLKDLTSAFMGGGKKFNKPVLIVVNQIEKIQRIGFITQNSLERIGLPDNVTVYLPHSYNFSGDLVIVPTNLVKKLDIPYAEVMKFIVSGGVAPLTKNH